VGHQNACAQIDEGVVQNLHIELLYLEHVQIFFVEDNGVVFLLGFDEVRTVSITDFLDLTHQLLYVFFSVLFSLQDHQRLTKCYVGHILDQWLEGRICIVRPHLSPISKLLVFLFSGAVIFQEEVN